VLRDCKPPKKLGSLSRSAETDVVLRHVGRETNVPADATLPGLRGLRDLVDLRPVIKIDSREQAPLVFTRLQAVAGTLYAGDYSIAGLESSFAVERKSIDDLANCCMGANRDRFEHELLRLRG
jgi:ERCC4-type nuclease